MSNIRAGTAYVDVRLGAVDKLKRDIESKVDETFRTAGDRAGEELGKRTSDKFEKSFGRDVQKIGRQSSLDFSEAFSMALRNPYIAGAGAIIAGILLPIIGGTIGAAITSGFALGGIAAGIALVADDPKIKKAGTRLKENLLGDLNKAAEVFVKPVLSSIALIQSGFDKALPDIKSAFAALAPLVTVLTTGIVTAGQAITQGFSNISQKAGPIIQALSDGIVKIGNSVRDMLNRFAEDPEAIKGMTLALSDFLATAAGIIQFLGKMIASLSRAWSQWHDLWHNILEWFRGTILPSFNRAGDQFNAIWTGVAKWFSGTIVPSLKRAVDQAIGIYRGFVDYIKSVGSYVSGVWNNIVSTVKAVPGKISAALSSLGSMLYNLGADAMRGFLNGLSSIAGGVIQKARDIAGSVVSTIKSALQIHSPSRVTEYLGKMTGLGFSKGFDASMPTLALPGLPSIPRVEGNFGSISEPQMDRNLGGGPAVVIENASIADTEDPWRFAENLYFLSQARGY